MGSGLSGNPPLHTNILYCTLLMCLQVVNKRSLSLMWLSRSRQSYSCRLKSVIFVAAAATSENCNEWATKIKTKFVSLIAKLQKNVLLVSQFHFVYCYCGTTVQHWHALLFGVYGNIGMSTMSFISIISITYVGNLAWHLCVNTVSGTCCK